MYTFAKVRFDKNSNSLITTHFTSHCGSQEVLKTSLVGVEKQLDRFFDVIFAELLERIHSSYEVTSIAVLLGILRVGFGVCKNFSIIGRAARQ